MGPIVSNERVGMAMPYLVLCLEEGDLLHVLFVFYCVQNFEPMLHGLAVGFLNGGEVGGRTFCFSVCCHNSIHLSESKVHPLTVRCAKQSRDSARLPVQGPTKAVRL